MSHENVEIVRKAIEASNGETCRWRGPCGTPKRRLTGPVSRTAQGVYRGREEVETFQDEREALEAAGLEE